MAFLAPSIAPLSDFNWLELFAEEPELELVVDVLDDVELPPQPAISMPATAIGATRAHRPRIRWLGVLDMTILPRVGTLFGRMPVTQL